MNNLIKLMCICAMSSGMAEEGWAYSVGGLYDTNQAQTQAEQTKNYYDNKRPHTITNEFQADKQAAQNEVSDTKEADKQTAQSDYPEAATAISTLQDIKKEYDNKAEEVDDDKAQAKTQAQADVASYIESNPEGVDTLEGYQEAYENDPEAQETVDDDKAQAKTQAQTQAQADVASYEDDES